jgi:hypothetical protein
MGQIFSTTMILAVSVGLFVYWFRCTVKLILESNPSPEKASQVPAANFISFLASRQQLYGPAHTRNLPLLCDMLQKEYRIISYLVKSAIRSKAAGYTPQQRLLICNFHLLRLWFWGTYRFRPQSARLALAEMSTTVQYFGRSLAASRTAA